MSEKKSPRKVKQLTESNPVQNELIKLMNLQFKPKKERLEFKEGESLIDIQFPEPFPIKKNNPDRFKMTYRLDLRLPLARYKKALSETYTYARKCMLLESRRGRYPDKEMEEIRKLQQEGLNDTEIFRRLHPEYKNFKFTRHYVIGEPGGRFLGGRKSAVAKLQRIRRISKRAREGRL